MRSSSILLVDDDEVVLATFGRGLRDLGYTVRLASSGEEAVQLAAEQAPDLAIVDKRMPSMSGFAVGRHLASLGIPFVFLSAYSETCYVEEAVEIGALGYLVKPLDVDRAVPTIEAALRRARDLFALRATSDRLESAIETGNVVNVVLGVMMERHRIGQSEAFDLLRGKARAERRKVRDAATEYLSAWYSCNSLVQDAFPPSTRCSGAGTKHLDPGAGADSTTKDT